MRSVWAIATIVIKELFRRKDFYVLFVLSGVLTLISGSASFFDDPSLVRYVKEICLLLIWISGLVIVITTSARQIPAERESRTIYPLLAKPVSRGQVLAGKFLGCWMAVGSALLVFYLFLGIVVGVREHSWPWISYLQACWLQWCMLGVVSALTILGSLYFAAPSSTSTITGVVVLGILLTGRYLHLLSVGLPEPVGSLVSVLYFLIPHLEFCDLRGFLIHDWGSIPWTPCGLATLYSWAYAALFLGAAWLRFRRLPLNQHR